MQSVKEKNLSLDRVLSIARFAAAMQIPNETLPEELDETPFEDQEESEGLDMTAILLKIKLPGLSLDEEA